MSPRWMDHAACTGPDIGDLFFAPDNEMPKAKDRRIAQAKVICAGCPVQDQCLTYAVDNDEEHGIWGGLTAKERGAARVRRKAKGPKPFPHGTEWGARRHREEGTDVCDPCRLAYNRKYETYRANNRAKKVGVTPYYDDGAVTIYHGDCREVLPGLTFDTFITSPPYNLGAVSGGIAVMADGYGIHDDDMADAEYVAWQRDVLSLMWAALSPDGAIFYNHKPLIRSGAATLPTRLLPDSVILRQIITWDRIIGANWSPSHLLPLTEWIMLLAKPGWRLPTKSHSHVGDVWRFPPEGKNPGHPCPFPVALPARILELTSGTVCDPFVGSGTTLVAAKSAGRKVVGIEVDERYCEIAAQRCAQGVLWEAS